MSVWNIANPFLKSLVPYEPGKPIEDVARELGIPASEIIKLASNENPLGPSPKAVQAMQNALTQSHLYPDGGSFYLRQSLSKKHLVDPSQIILGCGSNEILELLCHAFVQSSKDSILASRHAFVVYKLVAQLFNAEFIETSDLDFGHDLGAMLKAIKSNTKIVFIANPNNPTGTRIPNDCLYGFLKKVPPHVIVALDEAYYEFLDDAPPTVEWIKEFPNLIVLRTFSKIYGLAALRVGYSVSQKEVADVLQRSRQPFNITSLGQVAALAALEDKEHLEKGLTVNRKGMEQLSVLCRALGLKYIPSSGNFLMIHVGDTQGVFQALLKQGVIIRPLRGYDLPGWIRVSIGTEKEMEKFEQAFRKVLKK